jgi:hypothetical protein
MSQSNRALVEKWLPILEHASFTPIASEQKKSIVATILENTERNMKEDSTGVSLSSLLMETPTNAAGTLGFTSSAAAAGPVAGYDPVLISLVRRAMPNLIAYDIAGVQPMTGPTGLIFAMRSKYNAMSGGASSEAFYNEADTDFSGTGTHLGGLDGTTGQTTGTALQTAAAEALGSTWYCGSSNST